MPAIPKNAKVFARNAVPDDSDAIQKALNELKPGEWLVFPSGTYTIEKHLTVPIANVTLYGKGATIRSTNPADGALVIEADHVSIYGFTLDQDPADRQTKPWAGGISVYYDKDHVRRRVVGSIIQSNIIKNSGGAGVYLSQADYFTVADNTVWRSRADGIHMTGGSTNGRVIHNLVSQTGDDMIAIVSYAGTRDAALFSDRYPNWLDLQSQLNRNIYIDGNNVSDQYWGRGISVLGGSNVTIENNSISKIPAFAAIYLARETSYMTFGDHNILVRGNTISQVQTVAPSYKPSNVDLVPSQHGAIEVTATVYDDENTIPIYHDAFSISDIAIIGNKVQYARFSAIRIGAGYRTSRNAVNPDGSSVKLTEGPGLVRNVMVQGNELDNVGANNIVTPYVGLDVNSISCKDNSLNGARWPSQCDPAIPASTSSFSITGASLQCTANGILKEPVAPLPPSRFDARPR